MDGYLSQNTLTYYIMGEWFTGAIVILYLLFPVVLWLLLKNDKITFAIIIVIYLLFLDKPIVNPMSYWSLTSCLISFTSGMMLMKYKDLFLKKWCVIVCIVGFILLSFVEIPISSDICSHLMGLFLFGVLIFVGEILMRNKTVDKMFTELSGISYAIFLLQHVTIVDVLEAWNPSNSLKIIILLSGTIILVICKAKALTLVSNAVVKWIDKVIKNCF